MIFYYFKSLFLVRLFKLKKLKLLNLICGFIEELKFEIYKKNYLKIFRGFYL